MEIFLYSKPMISLILLVDNSFAFTVAIVGIMVVFMALVILTIIFGQLPKLLRFQIRNKLRKRGEVIKENCCEDISGETSAAIGMALHLFLDELHDHENMVITIKKVSKRYSPWSSKIYGLNNYYYRKN